MAAYFQFSQLDPDDPKNNVWHFTFKLTDAAKIVQARAILADQSRADRSVSGTIVKSKAAYNPDWSFHLEPDSIGFFENSVEVCDADVAFVEDHLDEVGGSTLPNSFWCPWESELEIEVTHLIDPVTEEPRAP